MNLKKDTVVIGLGKWGLNHIRILSSINRLEGVFDLDKNKIKNISKIFSCNGKKVMTYTMTNKTPFRFPTERYLNVVKRGYKDCKLDSKHLIKALVS